MSEHNFDFESGDLSLDFANTMDWHASQSPVEKLVDLAALVAWGEAAGLLPHHDSAAQPAYAVQPPEQAARQYAAALRLREAIFRIFSNRYAGLPVDAADLAALNEQVRAASANRVLQPDHGELRWEWAPGVEGVDRILWGVARAAADLLTSDRAGRVRECEDDRGCGYLFIDQSKNHSRRWCSMESCGNRAKARRHYSKGKLEAQD